MAKRERSGKGWARKKRKGKKRGNIKWGEWKFEILLQNMNKMSPYI